MLNPPSYWGELTSDKQVWVQLFVPADESRIGLEPNKFESEPMMFTYKSVEPNSTNAQINFQDNRHNIDNNSNQLVGFFNDNHSNINQQQPSQSIDYVSNAHIDFNNNSNNNNLSTQSKLFYF